MRTNLIDIILSRMRRNAGRPSAPALMTYNITHRCNARCGMCEIHGWDAGAELSATRFAEFIRDPELKKLEVIRITGGEPFLREDLPEIFRASVENARRRIFYVTTNGLLPARAAELVESAGARSDMLHIQVSLDAVTDLHDRLRDVPGAKDRAVETLRRLAELKKRFRFHAGINQTVMKSNLDQIEPVNALAEQLGVGHSLFLGAKHHEGKTFAGGGAGGATPFETQDDMTAEEIGIFYEKHRLLKSNAGSRRARAESAGAFLRDVSEEYLNEGGRNRLLSGKAEPNPPCMAFFSHFRLMPDGGVAPCSVMRNERAGDVATQPFSEVWRGRRADDIRAKVLACKGCWIECDVNPSVFFSGDIVPWFINKILKDKEFRGRYLMPPGRR